jgi:glycosyltransferase involved in cell wall biosynthesis
MSKILSLAIPTFNRKDSLLRSLNNISNQTDSIKKNLFEIVISDNCSTDQTGEVVSLWMTENPEINLKYNKNNSNYGYDINCHKAIEMSSGKYVWLISDDDFLKDHSIKKVIEYLNLDTDYSFCYVNYDLNVNNTISDSDCSIKTTKINDGNQMIVDTNLAFSFITSCIYNREVWKSLNYDNYYDTAWYNFYAARDCIIQGKNLLIGEPLVTQFGLDLKKRRNEKKNSKIRGYEFYIGAHLRFLSLAYNLKDYGYSSNTNYYAQNLSWSYNLRQIIYYKITQDRYNSDEIRKVIYEMSIYFKNRSIFWLIHVPTLVMPNTLIRCIYNLTLPIYKKLKLVFRA